ncbi:uncharacterized protein LOC126326202 [Schistocerca gregaria]|uniref:uncharacterized protein LOC126326202 n=1 Tax=Schistocerca gregaria TaxID=7010 RepID=UPI00211EBB06|nr:uncharacterized protein LOC126326202 [Schistocerca gregaria]
MSHHRIRIHIRRILDHHWGTTNIANQRHSRILKVQDSNLGASMPLLVDPNSSIAACLIHRFYRLINSLEIRTYCDKTLYGNYLIKASQLDFQAHGLNTSNYYFREVSSSLQKNYFKPNGSSSRKIFMALKESGQTADSEKPFKPGESAVSDSLVTEKKTEPVVAEDSQSANSNSSLDDRDTQELNDWPPFGRFPISFIALSIAFAVWYGYTCFVMREEKIIDRYEFIMWGGKMDRISNLRKLKKYLLYSYIGLDVTPRMVRFGVASAVLSAMMDPDPEVQRLATQVFCGYTCNPTTRTFLAENLNALFFLRRFAHSDNMFVWHAIKNLSEKNSKLLVEIASDEFIMESLFDGLCKTGNAVNHQTMRSQLGLLSNLCECKQSCELLAQNYAEKIRSWLNLEFILEPISLYHNSNIRVCLSKNASVAFPQAVEEVQNYKLTEKTRDTFMSTTISTQMILSLSTGIIWAVARGMHLHRKFAPLSTSEKAWIRRAIYLSPVASAVLSMSIYGLEQFASTVNDKLSYDSFRDIRKSALVFSLQIPLYWLGINFIGPFCILPSLIRVRYTDERPTLYSIYEKEINDILVGLGILGDKVWEAVDSDRQMDSIANIALSHVLLKKKTSELSSESRWWKFW